MQITVRVFKCCCSRFDYLFFFFDRSWHIFYFCLQAIRDIQPYHVTCLHLIGNVPQQRIRNFICLRIKSKTKKTEERRKKTNKETSNENKQMTSLFYFILAFRHCLNFNKLCTFFALQSAVVCFPSYSSIISLSHHALLGCFSIRL